MDMLHRRCAGLDVHKKTVVAAMRLAVENKLVSEVRTFATTTAGLLALSDWLTENSCAHAAMEANRPPDDEILALDQVGDAGPEPDLVAALNEQMVAQRQSLDGETVDDRAE